jgi:putative intracellular protease/amidase
MVVANPSVATTVGWPVGFWAAELTHPFYEFTEVGYHVTISSPAGGKVEPDQLSDPRDPSKWSSEDLISMGFLNTPELVALLADTPKIANEELETYDALVVAGGLSPMFTYRDNEDLRRAIVGFYEAEKLVAVYCHGVSALIDARLSDGSYLINGRPSPVSPMPRRTIQTITSGSRSCRGGSRMPPGSVARTTSKAACSSRLSSATVA